MKRLFSIALLSGLLTTYVAGQTLSTPPSGNNQKSSVTQFIGSLVTVTVDYSSPDVTSPTGEDRTGKIWGELVPYGLSDLSFGVGFGSGNPAPWRAGANESTVITFSHDVEIEGKSIAAGSYGLHLIPRETEPWTWIFTKNTDQWGSYSYDETDDVLRVDVQSEESEYHEWLTYEFDDRQAESALLALKWENLSIPMTITVPNYNDLYVKAFERELTGGAGFTYQNYVAASQFCLTNNTHLEKGLEWAEDAISAPFVGVSNFNTLQNKASILMALEKMTEAEETMMAAIKDPTATSLQIHQFGRQLITMDRKDKALEVFRYNYDRYDGAWPTHVGMARGLAAVGQYDEALKHAEIAVEEAPDEVNKKSMMDAVEKLKNKQDFN